jgi:serine/threonine-protein kinase
VSFVPPQGATLVRALGAGSVFEVAVVRHEGHDRICKRLTLRMLEEPVAQHALEREEQLLRRVQHPALPELYACGQDDWGPYLVETCLPGATLRELVAGFRERNAPVPAGLVAHAARAAFAALAELHGLSDADGPLELVHGDLSPDHVLLGRDGEVYLVDFGQARWRGLAPSLVGRDDRGTLPFVAPELARGEVEPTQASDVFALAATLAFVALGREPCVANSPAARLVEVSEMGLDVDGLAQCASLEPACGRALSAALAFDPAARIQRAGAVVRLLGG